MKCCRPQIRSDQCLQKQSVASTVLKLSRDSPSPKHWKTRDDWSQGVKYDSCRYPSHGFWALSGRGVNEVFMMISAPTGLTTAQLAKKGINEQDAVAWGSRENDDAEPERTEIVTLKRVEAFLKALKGKKPNLIFLHPAECSALSGRGVNEVFMMISMFLVSDRRVPAGRFKCNIL